MLFFLIHAYRWHFSSCSVTPEILLVFLLELYCLNMFFRESNFLLLSFNTQDMVYISPFIQLFYVIQKIFEFFLHMFYLYLVQFPLVSFVFLYLLRIVYFSIIFPKWLLVIIFARILFSISASIFDMCLLRCTLCHIFIPK